MLADEHGNFQKVIDLQTHARDAGVTITDSTVKEILEMCPDILCLHLTGCIELTDLSIWYVVQKDEWIVRCYSSKFVLGRL